VGREMMIMTMGNYDDHGGEKMLKREEIHVMIAQVVL
jgi:hypothetical protein